MFLLGFLFAFVVVVVVVVVVVAVVVVVFVLRESGEVKSLLKRYHD